MSDSENTEMVNQVLEESLKKMSDNLRLFSSSMRSLYAEKNIGASTDVSRKFRKLRDDTRQDAKVYLKVILPLITKFVFAIKAFFEYYDALSYGEWCEMLPNILEDIKAKRDLAQVLLKMHEEIMVSLKIREDEAKIIMTEFKDVESEHEKQVKEFQDKAGKKRNWAYYLSFTPVVNFIQTSVLGFRAAEDVAKTVAKMQESKIHQDVVFIVSEGLISALSNFMEGLSSIVGFFQTREMDSFEDGGNEIKESHFKVMKNKVKKINSSCHEFYAALPVVRTDFEAIPDEDTDQNYIDKWLEEKLKEIKKEERESTQKIFWDVVKGIQGVCLRPLLAITSSSLKPDESYKS